MKTRDYLRLHGRIISGRYNPPSTESGLIRIIVNSAETFTDAERREFTRFIGDGRGQLQDRPRVKQVQQYFDALDIDDRAACIEQLAAIHPAYDFRHVYVTTEALMQAV